MENTPKVEGSTCGTSALSAGLERLPPIPEGDRFKDETTFRVLGVGSGDKLYECWASAVRTYAEKCVAIDRKEREKIVSSLAILAKRSHTYCEDGWYSCPKAEDGCYNENRGPECDCGADEHNTEVDALMALLRSNG